MIETSELLQKYQPKQFKIIEADPQVSAARFSPCGRLLVGGGYDARVRRWNFQTDDFAELPPLEAHHGWVEGIAFSADGERLFTADSWGKIICWSDIHAETAPQSWSIEEAHDGWIRTLAVSPDGKLLASCAIDRKVKLWSTADGKLQHEIATEEGPLVVRFHPDGTLLLGDAKGIVHWLKLDGTLIRKFDAGILFTLSRLQDCGGVQCLGLDKDAKRLAVGGCVPKNGGTVVGIPTLLIFDMATGEQQAKFDLGTQNDAFVGDLHWHDEGFLSLITYGTPGLGQLLYVRPDETAPFLTEKKLANPHSISWHPDGKRFAVAATNTGSNGNGRPLTKDGEYKTNKSPIHLFSVPG